MRHIIPLLSVFLILPCITLGQVITYQVGDPLQSVLSHLAGPNVTVTGAAFMNAPEMLAHYQDNSASIGSDSGLVLVTGVHFVVMGPNNTENASFGSFPVLMDQDLYDLSVPNTFNTDVARLDLDLIPWGDTLSISYVFGSEEYDEWVCSVKDDRMGMFLSGPGIDGPFTNGAINMATLPLSGLPVTVNTVNNGMSGVNGVQGLCGINAGWLQNTAYYINNAFGPYTQLDAYTTVLTARAVVIPGESYHLKIAIADLDDDNYDSAVFLMAGSLQCNDLPTVMHEPETPRTPWFQYDAAQEVLTVSGIDPRDGAVQVQVFDAVGKIIAEGRGGVTESPWLMPMDLPTGTFLVRIVQGSIHLSGRILSL